MNDEVKRQLEELKPEGNFEDGIELYKNKIEINPVDKDGHGETYYQTRDEIIKSYNIASGQQEAFEEEKKIAMTKLKTIVFECLVLIKGRMRRCRKESGCMYSTICNGILEKEAEGQFKLPTEIAYKEELRPGLLFRGENHVVGTISGGLFNDKSREYDLPPRKQIMLFGGRNLDEWVNDKEFDLLVNSVSKIDLDKTIKELQK